MLRKIIVVIGLWVSLSLAHHGRSFLLNRAVPFGEKGEWETYFSFQYLDFGQGQVEEVEPGLSYALLDRLWLDMHLHLEKDLGESFVVENIGYEGDFALFETEKFEVGAIVEFEAGEKDTTNRLSLRATATYLPINLIANLKFEQTYATDPQESEWRLSLGYPISFGSDALLLEGEAVLDGLQAHRLGIGYRIHKAEKLFLFGVTVGMGSDAEDIGLSFSSVF